MGPLCDNGLYIRMDAGGLGTASPAIIQFSITGSEAFPGEPAARRFVFGFFPTMKPTQVSGVAAPE